MKFKKVIQKGDTQKDRQKICPHHEQNLIFGKRSYVQNEDEEGGYNIL